MEPNLEDIRLKEPEELEDDEMKVLKDNWDSLTDDEKGIFKDVNTESEPKKEEKKFGFGSQEEFDNAVTEKAKQVLEEERKAKEEAEKSKETKTDEERFFPEGYQAKDWDE